jgi:hypothetical protein
MAKTENPWQPVDSSMVIALCWEQTGAVPVKRGARGVPVWVDPETKEHYARVGTLHVAYHTGDVYRYEQVSDTDYFTLLGAESVGKAINKLLKPSRRGVRVGKLDPETLK